MSPRVTVGIVTWNSSAWLRECLDSLKAQEFRDLSVSLWDNASADGTRAIADAYRGLLRDLQFSAANVGFCAAQNRLIASSDSDYFLALNPDVILEPGYIGAVVGAMEEDDGAGSATGKLWRWEPGTPRIEGERILDTTGFYFTRNQRHLDRGSGEVDVGQYDRTECVFGASGAAAMYRRKMLEDARVGLGYFDEDFFAYREDADLAWRAQWLGWKCLYVPEATGCHVRRVLPERRASLPAEINMHSLKNRFLMRVKNMDAGTYLRFFVPVTIRDLLAFGYVLTRERSSLRALPLFISALPRAWRARRDLFRRRRVRAAELRKWFI